MDLTILDWGDCCVGHPLLDMPGLLDRAGPFAAELRAEWVSLWQKKLPDADVVTAIKLVEPIAIARSACVYQNFLDNIEPSEQIYHDTDVVRSLSATVELLSKESY